MRRNHPRVLTSEGTYARKLRSKGQPSQSTLESAVVATRRPLHHTAGTRDTPAKIMARPVNTSPSSECAVLESTTVSAAAYEGEQSQTASETSTDLSSSGGTLAPATVHASTQMARVELRNADTHMAQVESRDADSQTLAVFATKEDLEGLATKQEVAACVSLEHLRTMASMGFVEATANKITEELQIWTRRRMVPANGFGKYLAKSLKEDVLDKDLIKQWVTDAFNGDLMLLSRKIELGKIRQAARDAVRKGVTADNINEASCSISGSLIDLDEGPCSAACNQPSGQTSKRAPPAPVAGPSSSAGQATTTAASSSKTAGVSPLEALAGDLSRYNKEDLQKFREYLEKAVNEAKQEKKAKPKPNTKEQAQPKGSSIIIQQDSNRKERRPAEGSADKPIVVEDADPQAQRQALGNKRARERSESGNEDRKRHKDRSGGLARQRSRRGSYEHESRGDNYSRGTDRWQRPYGPQRRGFSNTRYRGRDASRDWQQGRQGRLSTRGGGEGYTPRGGDNAYRGRRSDYRR